MKGGLRQKGYLEEASSCRFVLDFITVPRTRWGGNRGEGQNHSQAFVCLWGLPAVSAEKCFLFPARLAGAQSLVCSVIIQAKVISHEKRRGGPWTWI